MRALSVEELGFVSGGSHWGSSNGPYSVLSDLAREVDKVVVTAKRNSNTAGSYGADAIEGGVIVMLTVYGPKGLQDKWSKFQQSSLGAAFAAYATEKVSGELAKQALKDMINDFADYLIQSEKDSKSFWDPKFNPFAN